MIPPQQHTKPKAMVDSTMALFLDIVLWERATAPYKQGSELWMNYITSKWILHSPGRQSPSIQNAESDIVLKFARL